MNEYESLIILNANSHEKSEEEMLAVVKSEFEGVGAEITDIEKMGKKGFSRIAKKKNAAGIYINLRFKAATTAVEVIKSKFNSVVVFTAHELDSALKVADHILVFDSLPLSFGQKDLLIKEKARSALDEDKHLLEEVIMRINKATR